MKGEQKNMTIFIKGDIWETEETKKIFSIENQISKFLQVEAALAKAEAKLGLIPKDAAEEINRKAEYKYVNFEEFQRQLEVTGHTIVSFIKTWKLSLEGEAAEYVHWGATSQDIIDSAEVLRLKEVYKIIRRDLLEIRENLVSLAEKHKNIPIAGRTHGQHAIPTTFGLKVAVWIMEINRHLERLEEGKKRLFYGSFFGAVGNLASLGEKGLEVKNLTMEYLDLKSPLVSWHTSRDSFAEFVSILAMISSTFGKIANEVVTLSRTEFGELEEPWKEGQVGSSTMPQKRNPTGSETIVAISKLVQCNASCIYQAMVQEQERDSRAWKTESFTIPTICKMTAKILAYSKLLLKDLVVYPKRMRSNLDITKGLLLSETLMMKLGEHIGRLEAHEKVYKLAIDACKKGIDLKKLVLEDAEIRKYLSVKEIEDCLDPEKYIGAAPTIVDNVLKAIKNDKVDHQYK